MMNLLSTFEASLKSLGTASTITGAGFYLHRLNFVNQDGTTTLARLSQQVTLPALFFTKILYCSQDYSSDPCPNVTDNLSDVWMLLLWPIYVVGCGLIVGAVVAKIARTPKAQVRTVLATCALGNSTALPITLLTVIHDNFPKTTELGSVDPTLFLSVYLLMYPILQWGLGGWLLAPEEKESKATLSHVLNYEDEDEDEEIQETTKQHLIRELSFTDLATSTRTLSTESSSLLPKEDILDYTERSETTGSQSDSSGVILIDTKNDVQPLTYTLSKIAGKVFQPPVIGALSGLAIAAVTPLRSIFVNLVQRDDSAPLAWFFEGLYEIGQAAVPVNMCILGINLSKTLQSSDKIDSSTLLSKSTTIGIIIGKMIVMPLIGVLSAIFLKTFVLDIPDGIDSPFYLVLMIVFITPTANNVMVMVELSGSNYKEGVARVIGWQYVMAPLLLSISVAMVVGLAKSLDESY